jgi:molecular chaperone HtpG
VTNRVLLELKKCADNEPATYEKIWKAFGPVIKEGLYEDMERRDQIHEIARFDTSKGSMVSLKDYVQRLKPQQTAIYYLTAEDQGKVKSSPQLEGYAARDIEVLLLTDPVDAFWVRTSLGFDGKPFKSVTQGAADLDAIALADGSKRPEPDNAKIATLIAAMKRTLGSEVKDVRASERLTESAVCLVADSMGLDRTLEKLLSRQGAGAMSPSAAILEINAAHPLITTLAERLKAKGVTGEFEEVTRLLLDEARILEGESLSDAKAFANRLTALMSKALT